MKSIQRAISRAWRAICRQFTKPCEYADVKIWEIPAKYRTTQYELNELHRRSAKLILTDIEKDERDGT